LYGVTPYKTSLFLVPALRTSNPTNVLKLLVGRVCKKGGKLKEICHSDVGAPTDYYLLSRFQSDDNRNSSKTVAEQKGWGPLQTECRKTCPV
jgi:hypothetical protein